MLSCCLPPRGATRDAQQQEGAVRLLFERLLQPWEGNGEGDGASDVAKGGEALAWTVLRGHPETARWLRHAAADLKDGQSGDLPPP